MIGIRGAVTIEHDVKDEIIDETRKLLSVMIADNSIVLEDIISIIFTCTDDISAAYPAEAARMLGIVNAGLICLNEMRVQGSLRMCLRILMHVNKDMPQNQVRHVYMGKASELRPDLISKNIRL